jgi:cytochrome c-type biogenesis protein CcmH
MTTFWIVAGLLVAVAVLFVVLPLARRAPARDEATADRLNLSIRKDQLAELEADLASGALSPEQYEQGRLEVERGLLEETGAPAKPVTTRGSRRAAVAMGLLVPVLVVGLYVKLGRLEALAPLPDTPPTEAAHDITAGQLAAMVQRLADRLKENPDDPDGWMMLGRSYSVLKRFPDAAMAYQKAYELVGDNPDVLTNYADALAMANGGEFTPRSVSLIERALKADPGHHKALWLMGTIAYEAKDYPKALETWQRLASLLPPGSDTARAMEANIAEVKDLMAREGGTPVSAPAAPPAGAQASAATPEAAPAAPRVAGTVTLDPALADRVKPDATLFIFARAAKGPRMPLAILRKHAGDLPVTFSLDASMSMMPGMSLADFPQVVVGARISASGGAIAQSGDLQGLTGPVAVGSEGLKVVIAEVVP